MKKIKYIIENDFDIDILIKVLILEYPEYINDINKYEIYLKDYIKNCLKNLFNENIIIINENEKEYKALNKYFYREKKLKEILK